MTGVSHTKNTEINLVYPKELKGKNYGNMD